MSDNAAVHQLLKEWQRRARQSQFSHYEAGKILGARHKWLGIPIITLTAFVGATLFGELAEKYGDWIGILQWFLSLLAAVLASLQTFLRYEEKSQNHISSGKQYGKLRRLIEDLLATQEEPALKEHVSSIRDEYDRITDESPNIPSGIWKGLPWDEPGYTEQSLLEKHDETKTAG